MRETYLIEAVLSAERRRCAQGTEVQQPLLLAMVLGTSGSTYQKAGACALFLAGEIVAGLVSGGCLEGELAELSLGFGLTGDLGWIPVRYDTRHAEDDLLGTALGCRGCLDLALIPLTGRPDAGRVFEVLESAWSASDSARGQARILDDASLELEVIESPRSRSVRPSDVAFGSADVPPRVSVRLPCLAPSAASARIVPETLAWVPNPALVLLPKRKLVYVLGCGSDSLPLLALLCECGFEVVAVDHRPVQLATLETWITAKHLFDSVDQDAARVPFSRAIKVISAENFFKSTRVSQQHGLSNHELTSGLPHAALVMSHHLDWDARYLDALREISPTECYIGLLGPLARRREVFSRLGTRHPLDVAELHSPMGQSLRARGPAALAVAVVADLLQFGSERPPLVAAHLSERGTGA